MNDIQLLNQASSAVMRVLSENSRLKNENEQLKSHVELFRKRLEEAHSHEQVMRKNQLTLCLGGPGAKQVTDAIQNEIVSTLEGWSDRIRAHEMAELMMSRSANVSYCTHEHKSIDNRHSERLSFIDTIKGAFTPAEAAEEAHAEKPVSERQIAIITFLQSTLRRKGSQYESRGFLTLEEAKEYSRTRGSIISHTYFKDGTEYKWFSDGHLYGYLDVENQLAGCVPCTSSLGTRVAPRPGLESGIINNFDDWLLVYHRPDLGEKLITDFNEFIRFIDENNLYTGE